MFAASQLRLEPIQEDTRFLRLNFLKNNQLDQLVPEPLINELEQALVQIETANPSGLLIVFCSEPSSADDGPQQAVNSVAHFISQSREDQLVRLSRWTELVKKLLTYSFPVVGLMKGNLQFTGLSLALACDQRIALHKARLVFPEVSMGLSPILGSLVKPLRLSTYERAIDLILQGGAIESLSAHDLGLVDQVLNDQQGESAALYWLNGCITDPDTWMVERQNLLGVGMLDEMALARAENYQYQLNHDFNHHELAQRGVTVSGYVSLFERLTKALDREIQLFLELAVSNQARALVGNAINTAAVQNELVSLADSGETIERVAVVGAGIMGGGIAYQSALSAQVVRLKEIDQVALAIGQKTASKALQRAVSKGRLQPAESVQILDRIKPQLDYSGFDELDLVIEAVVENRSIKTQVLAELEGQVGANTLIATNTSTLSITELATELKRPEKFIGLHFFNPVPQMALVEVIRGKKSSDQAIASALKYCHRLGKTPLLVNDCPGFFVNRVLFSYFCAFDQLLQEGADFEQIDLVMEAFGWPMGPAHLADVIGLDTLVQAASILAKAYPQRMAYPSGILIQRLLRAGFLGRKNQQGFYDYRPAVTGRLSKILNRDAAPVIESFSPDRREFNEKTLIERLMIPLCLEALRCLDEGIVGSAAEADMGARLGLGFPGFRGGPLRYIESIGPQAFVDQTERYAHLGELYQLTPELSERVISQRLFDH